MGAEISKYADVLHSASGRLDEDWDVLQEAGDARSWKSLWTIWEARFRVPQVYAYTKREWKRSFASARAWMDSARKGEPPDETWWEPEQPPLGPAAIEISVDIRTGRIVALSALLGYEGSLFGTVRTGMTVGQVMEAEPRFEHWTSDDGLCIPGMDGLIVPLDERLSLDETVTEDEIAATVVEEIRVFHPKHAPRGSLPS